MGIVSIATPIGGALYVQVKKYKDPSRQDIEEVTEARPSSDRNPHPHYNSKNRKNLPLEVSHLGSLMDILV